MSLYEFQNILFNKRFVQSLRFEILLTISHIVVIFVLFLLIWISSESFLRFIQILQAQIKGVGFFSLALATISNVFLLPMRIRWAKLYLLNLSNQPSLHYSNVPDKERELLFVYGLPGFVFFAVLFFSIQGIFHNIDWHLALLIPSIAVLPIPVAIMTIAFSGIVIQTITLYILFDR